MISAIALFANVFALAVLGMALISRRATKKLIQSVNGEYLEKAAELKEFARKVDKEWSHVEEVKIELEGAVRRLERKMGK